MFNLNKKDIKVIKKSKGKIDSERLYLLKQNAEVYKNNLELFIYHFSDCDLSKNDLINIYKLTK